MSSKIRQINQKKILKRNHSSNTILSSTKKTIENNSKYHTIIHPASKSFQISLEENNSKFNIKTRNQSKTSKINNNNESSLLKNLQLIDSDNVKLREVLTELNNELKEKDLALNQSQKLLKKMNKEYTQILNKYQQIEQEKNILKKDNERLKHLCNILNKNLISKEKKEKQNEQIKFELNKTKHLLNNYKDNFINISDDFTKIEKDMVYKELIINDLKKEGNKIINMVQDREMIIKQYSKKISELKELIEQKDEQIKLMVNFSKELNSENKFNIKEITKQAVKTLNTFYNSRNNNNKDINTNLIEIKNDIVLNLNKDENNSIINDLLSKKNCCFLINKAIKSDLYIPENGINFINKEFLEENNIKTNLIKTELYSSILREFNLFQNINNWCNKLNESLINIKIPKINKGKSIKLFKNVYNALYNILIKTKKENSNLKSKLNELKLYIKKLKNDFSIKNKKIKEKFETLINQYLSQNKNEKIISDLNNENKKENIDKNNSKKISELNKEIDKVKNINKNLNEEILNKEEIINKLRNDNNKLINKLNLYRTNPNAENNFKFYNSFSTKENSTSPTNVFLFSKNGDDLKLNTKKVLNIDNILNNAQNKNKMKDNKNNKNIKKNKSDINIFDNENEKIFIKNKNSFINLKIQFQENIFFKSNNNIPLKHLNNSDFINSILSLIKDFTSEINEEHFKEIIYTFFNSSQIIFILNEKISEIKKNLSLIKERFKSNNKDKKIKPSQFIDVLNEIEKLFFYLFNQLNKYSINSKNILPFLKCIFALVSIISYNNPLNINEISNNNLINITSCSFDINSLSHLMNTSTSNYNNEINNKHETKKYIKDKVLSNYINNQKSTEIGNKYFNSLFFINTKIFSSSELIKYRSIYEGLELGQILPVFKEICSNFKKIILNSKFSYESEISDLEENVELIPNKESQIVTENNTYHIVNEKIFGLKKFEFNFKLFFEVLKNYLVAFEIVVKYIEINMTNNQYKKQLEQILNNLYETFEDSACLNMQCLDDNTIFCRKILLALLLNQKEYLSNFI